MKCTAIKCKGWSDGNCRLFRSLEGGGTPSCKEFEARGFGLNREEISLERLIYEPSGLEKALTGECGFPPIPQKGYHTLYERSFETPTHAVITAYLEGGNHCGDRISVVVARDFKESHAIWGWASGFRFPVPSMGRLHISDVSDFAASIKRLQAKPLWHAWEVPGFDQSDGLDAECFHSQGWYTKGLFAYELPAPTCLPDAVLFRIREGIYATFPDGSMRLMPPKEYYSFNLNEKPVARQGDLLVLKASYTIPYDDNIGDNFDLDRHHLAFSSPVHHVSWHLTNAVMFYPSDGSTTLTITHPEHETAVIPLEYAGYEACLLPGVSRPFSRNTDYAID